MDNKREDDSEEPAGNRQQQQGDQQAGDELAAGSPGSHSNSSSSRSRQRRIVELLPENDNHDEDWIIRPEFYEEDVAQNSNSDDDETEDEHSIHIEGEIRDDDDDDDDDSEGNDDVADGFVLAPGEQDRASTDSDNDSDQTANYDTTLPVGHHYLGDNLEESRGRQVLVEGSTSTLLLFNLKHIVLFPGQVLPITTSNLNPRIQMCLKSCIIRGETTVGLMSNPQTNSIGTTAEIRNYSRHNNDEIRLIMEGRQRFKLLSAPFETAIEGEITILPEVSLGCPYPRISSLLKFYTSANMPNKFIISKHPCWVLKRYDAKNLMARLLNQIKDWCSADLTKDPSDFSYWVAANLPISNNARMKALSFSCTEARLVWLVDMLESNVWFGCSACKNVICHRKEVFPMSSLGPQCSFVNPGGFIHDTLTVRSAHGLIQEYGWSDKFSWFPGYNWRMANCDTCNRHIGWCYKSVNPATKPRRFFGLSRANVRLQYGISLNSRANSDDDVVEF